MLTALLCRSSGTLAGCPRRVSDRRRQKQIFLHRWVLDPCTCRLDTLSRLSSAHCARRQPGPFGLQALFLVRRSAQATSYAALDASLNTEHWKQGSAMAGVLQALTSDAWEGMLQRLYLRDLASLAACSRALKHLVDSQPESVWQAAASQDPGG